MLMCLPIVFIFLCIISNIFSNDISFNVFGNNRDGLPAAFGDFNSDGLIDLFLLRNGGRILNILLANETEPLLRITKEMECVFDNFNVTSVIPGDFDGDAFMDIAITTQTNVTNGSDKKYYDLRIIWGGKNHLNCLDAEFKEISRMIGQPLAIDYNQDMIIDLFGINEDNMCTFWVFTNKTSEYHEIGLNKTGDEIRIPHSNSFLDINGDYMADLMITKRNVFEILYGEKGGGFSHGYKYELPISMSGHVGQSIFLDVELSGELYLLLPFCYDINCVNSKIILYDNGKWNNLSINFQDDNQNIWGFIPPDDNVYTDTITLRGGDYNMDGYPDLLVTLRQIKTLEIQTFLLKNIQCNSCLHFNRTFEIHWNIFGNIQKDSYMSAFYDFYQDGILDFLILKRNSTNNNTLSLAAYKNNLDYDTNFIKVMVLTGLTNKIEPEVIGPLGKKKGYYGTNLPGPRISYNTLSQEGLSRSGVVTQLAQSAYFALNLPYSIFGLDRTPNFVDSLSVGLSNRTKTWTQLIPNSQIVVIPRPLDDPYQWKVQLFVTPSNYIIKSFIVYIVILISMLILVIYFHYKEKKYEAMLDREIEENEIIT